MHDYNEARARLSAMVRHHGPGHPDTEQARRDFAIARAKRRITEAVTEAGDLDTDTLARLRELIPSEVA